MRIFFATIIFLLYVASAADFDTKTRPLELQTLCLTNYTTAKLYYTQFSDLFDQKISVIYPGSCNCPNNCFEDLGNGFCAGKCMCSVGFTGKDCSIVDNGNTCSGNGLFSVDKKICICKQGFSGSLCDIKDAKLPELPKVSTKQYYYNDKYGEDHPLFDPKLMSVIHIEIDKADLDFLLDVNNMNSRDYKKVGLKMYSHKFGYYQSSKAGLRIRGMSSRANLKKQWKISFTAFGEKKKYSMSSFNLNAEVNDATGAHDSINYMINRGLGLPSPRTGVTELFINGIAMGYYVLFESINNNFLKTRIPDLEKGYIRYKCRGGANFALIGEETCKDYENDRFSYLGVKQHYECETNNCNWCDIRDVAVSAGHGDHEKLTKLIDTDAFARTIAFNSLVANWDDMIFNTNNYQVVRNPSTQKFELVVFDFDLSWGFDHIGVLKDSDTTWQDIHVDKWGNYGRFAPSSAWNKPNFWKRDVFSTLLADPEWKSLYHHYISELINKTFAGQTWIEWLLSFREMSLPAIARDKFGRVQFQYTFDDVSNNYQNDLTYPNGVLIAPGMITFMQERIEIVKKQINL
ncbi:hypothetical protein PCE1_000175 [Barthelona sp. PCE]